MVEDDLVRDVAVMVAEALADAPRHDDNGGGADDIRSPSRLVLVKCLRLENRLSGNWSQARSSSRSSSRGSGSATAETVTPSMIRRTPFR